MHTNADEKYADFAETCLGRDRGSDWPHPPGKALFKIVPRVRDIWKVYDNPIPKWKKPAPG